MKLDSEILDPFEVNDDWFEIILASLQLVVSDNIPESMRDKALFTIKRLRLRDGEKVIQQRQKWYEEFMSGEIKYSFSLFSPHIPELVTKGDYLGVKYSRLTPILLQGLKELKEEKRLLENKFYKALVDFENKFDAKVNYINIKRHQAMGCDDEIIAIHMEVNV